jgi:putative ABC transport system permease protein
MIKNHLKITSRNIMRHKGYSFINISGLAVGMACTILIFLWVQHELNYDRFHKNAEQIYRVNLEEHRHDGVHHHPWTPFPLAETLKEQFPEIVASTRLRGDHFNVKYQDKSFHEYEFLFVDPDFFEIFSFPLIHSGNPSLLLADPKSIVITDRMANKYFGEQTNPVGKILSLDNKVDFTVSGIVHIPDNTDFKADFYLSFKAYELFKVSLAELESNWKGKNFHAYILLGKDSSSLLLEKKISGFLKKYNPEREERLTLQELSQVHLYNPDGTGDNIRYVYVFSIIAIFILLIACVNFMNLATARSEKRAKEVGLRKSLGAKRPQLVKQFLTESVILSLFSFVISLSIVEALLPLFNTLSGKQLTLDFSNLKILLGLTVVALLTGILSGSYPALFLSSFTPVKVLKGTFFSLAKGSRLRNSLVIFQFSLSITLIICTAIVYSQLKYIQNKDVGLDKENLVYILMEGESKYKYETVKKELLKHPGILSASACHILPSEIYVWAGYLDWEGKLPDQKVYFAFSFVDFDYIPTFKMEIKAGRNFSREFPTDKENFILNEEAVRQMNLESPIGKQFSFWGNKGKIIGVVKDFNFQHLGNKIAPLVLSPGDWGDSKRYLVMRTKPGNPSGMIEHLREVWNRVNPGFAFDYHFFDETYDLMYRNEKRLGKILFYFAFLAIFISCLGLFGLASFLAERRTKEIGIRKTLGASVPGITIMLSKKFTGLVVLANVIGWPIAFYIMKHWLQQFVYRTSIGIEIFIWGGITALSIAWLTISYQSIKAALANPVEALRYE